ncbi:hypothetical protein Hanom_Chr02g00142871 [Helianthus anomalus]
MHFNQNSPICFENPIFFLSKNRNFYQIHLDMGISGSFLYPEPVPNRTRFLIESEWNRFLLEAVPVRTWVFSIKTRTECNQFRLEKNRFRVEKNRFRVEWNRV